MTTMYENNRSVCKYVHSTSRGHEAIQLATAFQLKEVDWVSPYYRDESLLLGLGFEPYQLMLQLLAKADDLFTGGREYYSHPNYKGNDKPNIIHQSSATGMQVIPTTGVAQGLQFMAHLNPPQGRTFQHTKLIVQHPTLYKLALCACGFLLRSRKGAICFQYPKSSLGEELGGLYFHHPVVPLHIFS